MRKYETIYSFHVLEEIKKGYKVYALDKFTTKTYAVHCMEVEDFAELLIREDEEEGRITFWKITEEETEE